MLLSFGSAGAGRQYAPASPLADADPRGPSTSPLEAAARTAQEDESTDWRRARAKNLRSTLLLARARWCPAQVIAGRAAGGFGLRSVIGARTVAPMGATSNNRWRGP